MDSIYHQPLKWLTLPNPMTTMCTVGYPTTRAIRFWAIAAGPDNIAAKMNGTTSKMATRDCVVNIARAAV